MKLENITYKIFHENNLYELRFTPAMEFRYQFYIKNLTKGGFLLQIDTTGQLGSLNEDTAICYLKEFLGL